MSVVAALIQTQMPEQRVMTQITGPQTQMEKVVYSIVTTKVNVDHTMMMTFLRLRCAAPVVETQVVVDIFQTMKKMMNTFGTAKTRTTEKLIQKAMDAMFMSRILIGVARMTQRISNHTTCAAGVEVEFHG